MQDLFFFKITNLNFDFTALNINYIAFKNDIRLKIIMNDLFVGPHSQKPCYLSTEKTNHPALKRHDPLLEAFGHEVLIWPGNFNKILKFAVY